MNRRDLLKIVSGSVLATVVGDKALGVQAAPALALTSEAEAKEIAQSFLLPARDVSERKNRLYGGMWLFGDILSGEIRIEMKSYDQSRLYLDVALEPAAVRRFIAQPWRKDWPKDFFVVGPMGESLPSPLGSGVMLPVLVSLVADRPVGKLCFDLNLHKRLGE